MKKMMIRLDTIEKVKAFSELIACYAGEADLASGRYLVDAKSVMGIFSLNLENVLELNLRGDNDAALEEKLKSFLA